MDPTDAVDVASAALGRRVDLAPTGSGGDHRSWWVGDDHVLRCAPDGSAGERLRREVRLRERLLARTSLPVPRSVASGSRHGQAWALDERLRGDPVDETGDTGAGVLRDLAALLVALDEVQSAESGDLGLPGVELPDLAGVVAGAVRACRALDLPRALSVLTGAEASALVRAGASHSPRVVLLHGDLKGEHLLLHDGRLSGVVDWADAGTGPVRLDVEGLAVAVGAERALTVAASAGVESVEAELGVLLARCRTTLRLAALRRGEPSGPGPLLARQWRLAWAGTSAQDDDVR